ncbi:MAG TPA: 3-dehydroquinate synthase family protein [Candidatus Cybelea sp.]|nr:3-dehydroquinate synthase family protein [Candidatus Cybelea sp.]
MAKRKEDRALERNDDLGYPIFVARDARDEVLAFFRTSGRPSAILCDANRHVAAVAEEIAEAAGDIPVLSFALGESRKRLSTVERVLDAMVGAGVERGSLVLGIGGGVAADLFGFACAVYMRGIRYAHVATSLVAMVDAAIGGKTGVDLREGKNLAGCFRDPIAVFCGTNALETLSAQAFREGLAEIVKAAIIEGGDLFDTLEELAPHPVRRWPWLEVLPAAIKVKTMAVADDRLETGARATLNLGHTFAHAIERASNYSIAHGKAVALGLRAAGLLALRTGRFTRDEHLRVLALLALVGLPLQTSLAPDAIFTAMRSDKKKSGGRLRFVLPRAIGDVEYGVECTDRTVRAVLERMQHSPEKLRARR